MMVKSSLCSFMLSFLLFFALSTCLKAQPQVLNGTHKPDLVKSTKNKTDSMSAPIQASTVTTLETMTSTMPKQTKNKTSDIKPTSSGGVVSEQATISSDKPTSKNVPNPEVGVYVVILFLVVASFLVIVWLILLIAKRRRRRFYRQPSPNARLRTDAKFETEFENPIQFPPATYGNAVI